MRYADSNVLTSWAFDNVVLTFEQYLSDLTYFLLMENRGIQTGFPTKFDSRVP